MESSRSLTQSAATKDLSIELQHWKTSSEQYEQRWRNALNQILAIGGDAGSGGGCGIVGASSKAATSPLSPGAANPCPRAPESSSSMMASLAEKHGREISKMQSEMEILFNAKIE